MTTATTPTIEVGTRIRMHFGPYRATCEVVAVNDRGAVLALPALADLIGYSAPLEAPDGTQLAENNAQTFLGRAHWPAAEVLRPL